jgi:hypothetical protein
MPDGFDPHTELARIYNLRDLMNACRERAPSILNQIDEMLVDTNVPYADRIRLFELVLNRGFGKPRQTVYVHADGDAGQNASRVKVYIPDNGRTNTSTRVIDGEAA